MSFNDVTKDIEDSDEQGAAGGWLVSMADLISLVLTFFVMIYATKDISEDSYAEVRRSIVHYFNIDEIKVKKIEDKKEFVYNPIDIVDNFSYTKTVIDNILAEDSEYIRTELASNRLKIIYSNELENVMDDAGKELAPLFKEELYNKLFTINKALEQVNNQIEITVDNIDMENSIKLTKYISSTLDNLGYKKNILMYLPSEKNVDNGKQVEVVFIVRDYESIY